MATVRWMRISEAFARLGHQVDIIINSDVPEKSIAENLRYVDAKSGLGYVADFMDDEHISSLLQKAANKDWDRQAAMSYMVENHTWDKRVSVYHSIISECESIN